MSALTQSTCSVHDRLCEALLLGLTQLLELCAREAFVCMCAQQGPARRDCDTIFVVGGFGLKITSQGILALTL